MASGKAIFKWLALDPSKPLANLSKAPNLPHDGDKIKSNLYPSSPIGSTKFEMLSLRFLLFSTVTHINKVWASLVSFLPSF
jgi:hypothetical protein